MTTEHPFVNSHATTGTAAIPKGLPTLQWSADAARPKPRGWHWPSGLPRLFHRQQHFTAEEMILIAATSPFYRPDDLRQVHDSLPEVSWSVFAALAKKRNLLLLAEPRLRHLTFIPAVRKILEETRKIYFRTLRQNLEIDNLTVQISLLLASAGLPVLLFRGTPILRQYFGDLGLHLVEQMDLMIHRKHVERAAEILYEIGFEGERNLSTRGETISFHRWLGNSQHRVVLHQNLWKADSFQLSPDEIWRRALPYSSRTAEELQWLEWDQRLNRPQMFTLSPEIQFLYGLHTLSEPASQNSADFIFFGRILKTFAGRMNWSQLVADIIRLGWENRVRQIAGPARQWGMPLPDEFLKSYERTPLRERLRRMLASHMTLPATDPVVVK